VRASREVGRHEQNTPGSRGSGGYQAALSEARRAADEQMAELGRVRDRAAGALTIGGLTGAFLGGLAVRGGIGLSVLTWVAVAAFVAMMMLCMVVLSPAKVHATQRPDVLVQWVENEGADADAVDRDLALYLGAQYEANLPVLARRLMMYQAALGCLLLLVAALVADLWWGG
jgi:hypothetical protein